MSKRLMLLALALGVAGAAHAQTETQPQAAAGAEETITTSEEIVITGQITYRDRTAETAPVLEYGLDYFQRFEPLSAGDALKRVPGVAFVGTDILESDQAQLRGLGVGYTQILINGEQVPGSGDDRTFFLDRIPAELIERVEVVRSASASRSGDAVAGALNIVLRDSFALDGGFVRGGVIVFPDDELGELLGGAYGGQLGPGRFLVGANLQARRNPKEKLSLRFEPNDDDDAFEFVNREDQTDLRDGTDYSFNGNYITPAFGGELDLSAFYVRTDRGQFEDSIEYGSETGTDDLLTINENDVDIQQDNYTVGARFNRPLFGGEFKARIGYSEFVDDIFETEFEADFEDEEVEGAAEVTDRTDQELTAKLAQELRLGEALKLEFGVDYKKKERDTVINGAEAEEDGTDFDLVRTLDEFEPLPGGVSLIEETRIDPYVQLNGKAGERFAWELGLRFETTDIDVVVDEAAAGDIEDVDLVVPLTASNDYSVALPSAHLRYNLTTDDRINLSVARTVRRPGFNELSPALLDGEFGDNDFIGNPNLDPETAWGVDIGYERRLGRRGVFGVNAFYRDITDLIEVFNTGAASLDALDNFADDVEEAEDEGLSPGDPDYPEFDPESFVFSARNTGDATVMGIELDVAAPLDLVGLPNTGVFANYAWLDSEVTDELGDRRINNQAEYVFNAGFIHDIPAWAASFGVTYRDQGQAVERVIAESVLIEYSANLELFIEKRFGERFVVRATGSNLLDGTKDERFEKFDNLGDQLDGAAGDIGAFDELEFETEEAGPVFQLIGRVAF